MSKKNDMEINEIRKLAKKFGWTEYSFWPTFSIVHFSKDGVNLTVKYGVLSEVVTEIYHPKSKAWTTLVRAGCDKELLEKVFDNPRVHTKKGKYDNTKKSKAKKLPKS